MKSTVQHKSSAAAMHARIVYLERLDIVFSIARGMEVVESSDLVGNTQDIFLEFRA